MTLGNDNGTDGQTDGQTECDAICGPLLGRRAAMPHNKPQAATEFSAKLDVCRIQYCSYSQVLSVGDVGFSVSSSSSPSYIISKL